MGTLCMGSNIEAFERVLDSSDNSTGGGTASCVAGAMAAGLIGMVARLSMGKAELMPTEHYERIAKRAEQLSRELFDGGRIDSDAFSVVSLAFKMPKETTEQKQTRSLAIQKGMLHCAEVPLANAQKCQEVSNLADQLAEKFNLNAASDLQCAQYLVTAGLNGCAANVRINLPAIKDQAVIKKIEAELMELR
jgi:formiminotetrahydrofolate cyclodeaminase